MSGKMVVKSERTSTKPLLLGGRAEWHTWLEQHHDTAAGVWLVVRKKGADAGGVYYDAAVEEAICFGWIDGKMQSVDAATFILRFSPRRKNSVWSKLNRNRAEKLMGSGRMTKAGLEKIRQAKTNGSWQTAYSAKEKPVMPADLKQALQQAPPAWKNFKDFADSYQTMYIGWIENAKRAETRTGRIRRVVERARQNIKPGMM
jgi:uncharacterized protein YdeI (YjbR/CyaY-like superfamily)